MYAYLSDGDIECSNNRQELMLRRISQARKTTLHFYSNDGYQGDADLMTIIRTCELLELDPYLFIQWAFYCAKLRLEEYRLTHGDGVSAKQLCYLPTPQYIKTDFGKIKIPMYGDKRYECVYDKIDWTGIDPWTYIKLMEQEDSRLINPLPDDDED